MRGKNKNILCSYLLIVLNFGNNNLVVSSSVTDYENSVLIISSYVQCLIAICDIILHHFYVFTSVFKF